MWNKTDWTSRTNGDGLVPGKLITTYAGEFSLHLHGKSSASRTTKRSVVSSGGARGGRRCGAFGGR